MEHLGIQTRDNDIATLKLVNDAKKMTRTSASNGVKLFLVGAATQDANGAQTNTIAGCYIGTDGYLYSNSKKIDATSWGTSLGAASNALTLKNSAGAVLSTITAANLVTVLGTTPVKRAAADADGNNIVDRYQRKFEGTHSYYPLFPLEFGDKITSTNFEFYSNNSTLSLHQVNVVENNWTFLNNFMADGDFTVEQSTDNETWTEVEKTDSIKGVFLGSHNSDGITLEDNTYYRATVNISSAHTSNLLFVRFLFEQFLNKQTTVWYECYSAYTDTWTRMCSNDTNTNCYRLLMPNNTRFFYVGTNTDAYTNKIRFHIECGERTSTYNKRLTKIHIGVVKQGIDPASNRSIYGAFNKADISWNLITTNGIYPKNNNASSLGSSSYKWANVYATTFHGALSGSASQLGGHESSWYQQAITSTNKLAASLVSGLATVATSGSYNDLSSKPTALKNPYALTFGSKTYDGSAAKEIVKADLGLGNVENKSASDILGELTENDIYALLSAARKAAVDSGVTQEGLATIDAAITTINGAITTLQGRATAMEEALEARDWFAYDEDNNMIYVKPGTGATGSPHDRGLFAYGSVSAGGIGTIGGGGGGESGDIPHVFLTEAEYEALAIKDPGTLYFTYEE